MSSHATAETLSAYLDRQLVEPEAKQLEEHIESCTDCHVRLEGLRRVVSNLQTLEPVPPPASLQHAVARRIALTDDRPTVADRFEQGLSIFSRQSPILSMFAVVIALAMILYFFSWAIHQQKTGGVSVIFEDPPAAAEVEEGALMILGDRELRWRGGLWVQQGVSAEAVTRTLAADSVEARELLAAHPELAGLAGLGKSAVVAVDGEVVRLDP